LLFHTLESLAHTRRLNEPWSLARRKVRRSWQFDTFWQWDWEMRARGKPRYHIGTGKVWFWRSSISDESESTNSRRS